MPEVMDGMNNETKTSFRASIDISSESDKAVQELVPYSDGYKLVVPSNRLVKSVNIGFKMTNEQLGNKSVGLYECSNNSWKLVKTTLASGTARFSTKDGSLFALMQPNRHSSSLTTRNNSNNNFFKINF